MAQVTNKAGALPPLGEGSGDPAGMQPLGCVLGPAGVPVAAVAMRLAPGADAFHLVLLDADNQSLLALGPYPEDDVVAEWRQLAARAGLPLKILLPTGAVMTPFPQIGPLQLGAVRIRRRHGLLNHRRPRFLTRRKTGRFPLRPQVHREREIAGRGGR